MDEDKPEPDELVTTMRPEYDEAEAIDAQNRFSKIITIISTAHTFGLLACFGVWRQ